MDTMYVRYKILMYTLEIGVLMLSLAVLGLVPQHPVGSAQLWLLRIPWASHGHFAPLQ